MEEEPTDKTRDMEYQKVQWTSETFICIGLFFSVKNSPQASSTSAMFVLSELTFDLKEVCEISRLTSEFSGVESVHVWSVLFAVWL